MKNMENIPEELKQRVLDAIKKWQAQPILRDTFLTENATVKRFMEKNGVMPWMYERLVERFTEVIR